VPTSLIQLSTWDFESSAAQNPQGDLPWFDLDSFDAFLEFDETQHSLLNSEPKKADGSVDLRVNDQFSGGDGADIVIAPQLLNEAPGPLFESQPLSSSLYQSM